MKKSLTILCAVLILMSFSLAGFGQTNFFDVSQATPPKAIPAKDMTVFVIVKASEDEFWQIVLDGAAKGAKHFGVKFIHQEPSSESEISKQISILETAIFNKPRRNSSCSNRFRFFDTWNRKSHGFGYTCDLD